MMKKAELQRIYYRAIGQQMMTDTLSVDFKVNGETFTHQIPNRGWSYENPSLLFLGYVDLKPSDIDGTQYVFDEKVMCPVVRVEDTYRLDEKPFKLGKYFLQESDWFDPKGDVWDSGQNKAFGGMNVEPSTGNRAAVDGDEE